MNDRNKNNPLDQMGIRREHIIAVKQAFTHTNKQSSSNRAKWLNELFYILETFDRKREGLYWEDNEEI
tara:strand:+ start:97 stop:300 length:204 start_codon:yes stop_codon:yes gene_type:complete